MAKQRILAIEYIRGISMLGVVGIHTGAYSLTNPHVNVHLFAIWEIFTRFSVPIFFFVSAFGLFISQQLFNKLNYAAFMTRRLRTVLIPYVTWSLLYMLHYTLVSGDTLIWHPPLLSKYFLFGLASYQLYFLVILLWFYALMPLWRLMVRWILIHPIRNLLILLMLQILFNYYSSYLLRPTFANEYINLAIQHRLSYWVLHYVFIFVLGAVCAVRYEDFKLLISRNQTFVKWFFTVCLAGMLAFYYYLLYIKGYTPEEATNTAHQLSPIGVLYTLSSTLFWYMLFTYHSMTEEIQNVLRRLGDHSYMVYLVHPLIMYYLTSFLASHNIIMTSVVTISFFLLTVCISLLIAVAVDKLRLVTPIVGTLLIGSKK